MQRGQRLALAATIAMAAITGTASADLRPREAAATTATAPTAAPAVPTFANGMAQAVFAAAPENWVNHELWVETTADSDGDGKHDRVHVDVSRPAETDTDGLKVPVIYEDSPYYAGGADVTELGSVDHELGAAAGGRLRAPDYFQRRARTSPRDPPALRGHWVPRGFAVVHSESPGSGQLGRLHDLRRPNRDDRRHRGDRLAQRPCQGLHHQDRDRGGQRLLDERQRRP